MASLRSQQDSNLVILESLEKCYHEELYQYTEINPVICNFSEKASILSDVSHYAYNFKIDNGILYCDIAILVDTLNGKKVFTDFCSGYKFMASYIGIRDGYTTKLMGGIIPALTNNPRYCFLNNRTEIIYDHTN